jgi:hypothetical protein
MEAIVEVVSMKSDDMPNPAFTIRELEERDLPELAQIMVEGFPRPELFGKLPPTH